MANQKKVKLKNCIQWKLIFFYRDGTNRYNRKTQICQSSGWPFFYFVDVVFLNIIGREYKQFIWLLSHRKHQWFKKEKIFLTNFRKISDFKDWGQKILQEKEKPRSVFAWLKISYMLTENHISYTKNSEGNSIENLFQWFLLIFQKRTSTTLPTV